MFGNKKNFHYLPWNISIYLISCLLSVILCILSTDSCSDFYWQIFNVTPIRGNLYSLRFLYEETSRSRITVYVVFKSLINWEIGGGGGGRISPSAPVPFGQKFKDDGKVFPPLRISASWHFSFSNSTPSINTPHTCLRRMNLHSSAGDFLEGLSL
jgi:hypothetical protein